MRALELSPPWGTENLNIVERADPVPGRGEVVVKFLPWIGAFAALLTSLSYLPQVRKALPRGSTKDLSLKTFGILTAGLFVWIIYGVLKADWVILAGNGVGAALSATKLGCKVRDMRSAA